VLVSEIAAAVDRVFAEPQRCLERKLALAQVWPLFYLDSDRQSHAVIDIRFAAHVRVSVTGVGFRHSHISENAGVPFAL